MDPKNKNRLQIPSEVRKNIVPEIHGKAFFITLRGRVPCFYPELYYLFLYSSRIPPDITPSDDLLAYTQLKFGLSIKVEPDSQGRVVLPETLITRARLNKEVTLVGMQDHLILVNRSDWDARAEKIIDDGPEIEERVRAKLPPPSNG